jgi:hypothetical protein
MSGVEAINLTANKSAATGAPNQPTPSSLGIGRLSTSDGNFVTAVLVSPSLLLTVRHGEIGLDARLKLEFLGDANSLQNVLSNPVEYKVDCDEIGASRICKPLVGSVGTDHLDTETLDYAFYRVRPAKQTEDSNRVNEFRFSVFNAKYECVPENTSLFAVGYSTNPFFPRSLLISKGGANQRSAGKSGLCRAHLLHNLQVGKGMSGAPIFDFSGRLVAIQSRALWPDVSLSPSEWGESRYFVEELKDYFVQVFANLALPEEINAFALPNLAIRTSAIVTDASRQGFSVNQ